MSLKIFGKDLHGVEGTFNINRYPDECPICHANVNPKFVAAIYHEAPALLLHCAFQCTRLKCGHLFLAIYEWSSGKWAFSRIAPVSPKPHIFAAEIQEVSPTFVDIYNQTVSAEAANLDQLTGIGLRKALEFLVKDYAASQKPEDENKIKEEWLGRCIDNYIDDPKIKQCAQRAVWLANDETHYIRKWEDKDITDLKLLIKLTVNWVENSLLTEKYTKEMTGSKKAQGPKTEGG
jgi:hypothetical protein